MIRSGVNVTLGFDSVRLHDVAPSTSHTNNRSNKVVFLRIKEWCELKKDHGWSAVVLLK
jgi:hypothetical protein